MAKTKRVYWFHHHLLTLSLSLYAELDWNMTACSHEWIHYLNCALCHRFMSSLAVVSLHVFTLDLSSLSHFFDVIWLDWCLQSASNDEIDPSKFKINHEEYALLFGQWVNVARSARFKLSTNIRFFSSSELLPPRKFIYSRTRARSSLYGSSSSARLIGN